MMQSDCALSEKSLEPEVNFNSPCVQKLYPLLMQDGRKRIPIGCVRHMFEDAFGKEQTDSDFNSTLKIELVNLARMRFISFPPRIDGLSWTSEETALPECVFPRLVSVRPAALCNPSSIDWEPELYFCTNMSDVKMLLKAQEINEFLKKNRGTLNKVPVRERALQIFGDEKALDSLVQDDALFGGRLPLSAIGALDIGGPITYQMSGEQNLPILVVENHHTYWSFCKWNAQAKRYSAVVFGGGGEIFRMSKGLAFLKHEIDAPALEYFGDIDYAGLRIPAHFNLNHGRKCMLQPAREFYDWLLKHGVRRPKNPEDINEDVRERGLAWLDSVALQCGTSQLFGDNKWIPQESLGFEALLRDFRQ